MERKKHFLLWWVVEFTIDGDCEEEIVDLFLDSVLLQVVSKPHREKNESKDDQFDAEVSY